MIRSEKTKKLNKRDEKAPCDRSGFLSSHTICCTGYTFHLMSYGSMLLNDGAQQPHAMPAHTCMHHHICFRTPECSRGPRCLCHRRQSRSNRFPSNASRRLSLKYAVWARRSKESFEANILRGKKVKILVKIHTRNSSLQIFSIYEMKHQTSLWYSIQVMRPWYSYHQKYHCLGRNFKFEDIMRIALSASEAPLTLF